SYTLFPYTTLFRSLRQTAQFRHACVLPSCLRLLHPFNEQNEGDNQLECPGWNPHDQSTDLLIFERSEMPCWSSHHVGRVPGPRCKGEQRSQDAGVQNCREDVNQSPSITESGSSVQNWPPKHHCCYQESRVLCRVDPVTAQCLIEEPGNMPDPQCKCGHQPCRERD